MSGPTAPPRFYFNGRELPRWASQWHLLSLPFSDRSHADDWDEFIDHRHIWHLQCRIDHTGVVGSEDPLIFRICAQEILHLALDQSAAALTTIRQATEVETAEEIHTAIVAGLGQMIMAAHTDRRAFWISGGEEDRLLMLRTMGRLHPHVPFSKDYSEPHAIQRRSEQLLRSQLQLTALRRLAERSGLPKSLRKLLLELPPNDPE